MIDLPSLEQTASQARTTVAAVSADQLGLATPCTEWDVRALIGHINGGGAMFAKAVEDGSLSDEFLGSLMTEDQVGDDHVASVNAMADHLESVFGAVRGDPIVSLPFMPSAPVSVVVNLAVMDLTCHLVDLARATGQDLGAMDQDLLATADALARQMVTEGMRKPGYFGEPVDVADDAPTALRLQAFLGRAI